MQILSIGDNLHEMSNPVFWEKIRKKKIEMSSAENITQSAKRYTLYIFRVVYVLKIIVIYNAKNKTEIYSGYL